MLPSKLSISILACSVLLAAVPGCRPKRPPMPPPTTTTSTTTAPDDDRLEPVISDPTAPAPVLDVRLEPSQVAPGESALMSWTSQHADRVLIDQNIGPVEVSGRIKLFPEVTTSYHVRAVGPGGVADQTATIEVITGGAGGGDILQEDLSIPVAERFATFVKPIFFDFDSAELSEEARLILDGNIRWLERSDNRELQILIEGHCDSRGTEEYNLALGDRRAVAVREYLARRGVSARRITTLTLGEERPFAVGEAESDHALNRRAHFVLIQVDDE